MRAGGPPLSYHTNHSRRTRCVTCRCRWPPVSPRKYVKTCFCNGPTDFMDDFFRNPFGSARPLQLYWQWHSKYFRIHLIRFAMHMFMGSCGTSVNEQYNKNIVCLCVCVCSRPRNPMGPFKPYRPIYAKRVVERIKSSTRVYNNGRF